MPTNNQNPDEGRLKIGVFAGDPGHPVADATVRVLNADMTGQVYEELITDDSGQAPLLNLPAPPLEYSQETGEHRPYSEYDLEVSAEGFGPQLIHGVQILPDTTAQQEVFLPLGPENRASGQILSIGEHTLWGIYPAKIPEDDVKNLPPATGQVVLPDPVIPEFIIVHDGKPSNAAAPNYWIPFGDYIKNVASSEIYANWPQATITANVLAIISFTLNRVYTEWYRGKGYNFTITSSTAYDHAFSYGRTIYHEISAVVDHIFTNFITRPGIRQPLLTQYCDGKRVTCPNWLSQWGSKRLGDQGYEAIDILKSYYGYDIYLMQAPKVAGVPSSYPGTPLQMGSSGEAVRTIQGQLNAIANNYPAIGKVRVDGLFGEETRQAVETFQYVFHLAADGIVGFATWYRISDIYTAVTRLAELV